MPRHGVYHIAELVFFDTAEKRRNTKSPLVFRNRAVWRILQTRRGPLSNIGVKVLAAYGFLLDISSIIITRN